MALSLASVLPCSLSFLSPVNSLSTGFSFLLVASAMFFHDDVVQFLQFPSSCPLLDTMLTPGDVHELLSLVQAEDPGVSRAVYSSDERKLRRMQSNRESARRSRWRKKRHLENLKNQVNRLKTVNRQLKNQLGFTLHQHLIISLQNAQLRSESEILMTRLWHLYRDF